jgi:hypothetical protein
MKTQITAAIIKFRLPILLIFGPIFVLICLWLLMWLMGAISGTSEVALLDNLPEGSSQFQQVSHNISYIFAILWILIWKLILIPSIFAGIVILIYKLLKK